jgi:hypothetical protein
LIYKWYDLLSAIRLVKFPLNPDANFVISIASYPARIHQLPAVFESVARQITKPSHIYLVLSVEEWPEKKLPKFIRKLERIGVEIVWTRNNPYSVKMLIPILELQPNKAIITLGDDFIYAKSFIERTISVARVNDGAIVGPLGKILFKKGNSLAMYNREKRAADITTPSAQLYLMGLGTYYPPNSLDSKVCNLDAITKIIPGRGSDLWFWAAAVAKGTRQICLGENSIRKLIYPIPENRRTVPRDRPGKEVMEERFQNTVDYFGIRQILISQLPNKHK